MTRNRSNANLSTLVLYAKKDIKYLNDLESHLRLIVEDNRLGYLKCVSLEEMKIAEKSLNFFLDRPTCLLCLLTPNFIYSTRSQGFLWDNLVRVHKAKQLLLIPVIAEDCSHYEHPFSKLSLLPQSRKPLSVLASQGDYSTHLSELGTACQQRLTAAITHNERVELNWQNAKNDNTSTAYENFCTNFGDSKYGATAKQCYEALWEEELWKNAEAFDQTAHYLNYFVEAPLRKHEQLVIEKIIQFEKSHELLQNDVANNENLGLLYDYKSRFRKEINTDLVNKKLDNAFAQPLRLSGEHPWARSEAHALKLKVFKECNSSELYTYSLLEETGKTLLRNLAKLKEKLNERKNMRWLKLLLIYPLLLVVFTAVVLWSVSQTLSSLIAWFAYHYLFSFWIILIIVMIQRHIFRSLATETNRCDELMRVIEKELVQMKIAFIAKLDYTKALRLLHNIEEWGNTVDGKKTVDYVFNGAEEINTDSFKIKQV